MEENEVKKEVVSALNILSALAVTGDAVDLMAASKQKLKRAIKLLEEGDANG